MTSKVRICAYKRFLLIAVIAYQCTVLPVLSASEITGDELPGLDLFIPTSEQLNMEKELRESKADKDREEESQKTTVNEEPEPILTTEEQDIYPQRYDGVVFRGDRVLDVWFDGSRLAQNPGSSGLRIEYTDQSGQVVLSTDSDSYELNPGDAVSQKYQPSSGLPSTATSEIAGGVVLK